jgi:hypothetical protein
MVSSSNPATSSFCKAAPAPAPLLRSIPCQALSLLNLVRRRKPVVSPPERPVPLRFRPKIQALLRPTRSRCSRFIRSEARLGAIAAGQCTAGPE